MLGSCTLFCTYYFHCCLQKYCVNYFTCVCDREFESNASGLLGTLYEIDKDVSRELIKRRPETRPNWKRSNVLELAYNAELKDFMNNTCCQDTLYEIWRGKLSTTIPWWKVWLKCTLNRITEIKNPYSPNKHGRTVNIHVIIIIINNTNRIKTKQLHSGQKHLKLSSNFDTRLTHNILGKAKPKYSWQYFTTSMF